MKTIAILGTGPSLDRVDWPHINFPVVAVNWAALVVPRPLHRLYVAAMDRIVIPRVSKELEGEGWIHITGHHSIKYAETRDYWPTSAVETIAVDGTGCGSSQVAVRWALEAGFDHFIMYGFDGGAARAASVQKYYENIPQRGADYNNGEYRRLIVDEVERATGHKPTFVGC